MVPVGDLGENDSADEESSGIDVGSDDDFEGILQLNPQPRHHFEIVVPKLSKGQKQ